MIVIVIDGIERPIHNSEARLIHPTEEGIVNFWRWFGDSEAVDAHGRPLVLFHGTTRDFDRFAAGTIESEDGFFLTTSAEHAAEYGAEEEGMILPVYVRVLRPYRQSGHDWSYGLGLEPQEARAAGHDSHLILGQEGGDTYIAFEPGQIKSALGNSGLFAEGPSLTDTLPPSAVVMPLEAIAP